MVYQIALPFGAGVSVRGKSSQPGRPVMEFDKATNQSSDRPVRNPQGEQLYRHPASLQLAEGADVLDVQLTVNQERGFGAYTEIILDPTTALVQVANQKDGFDLKVSVSGSVGAKKASS